MRKPNLRFLNNWPYSTDQLDRIRKLVDGEHETVKQIVAGLIYNYEQAVLCIGDKEADHKDVVEEMESEIKTLRDDLADRERTLDQILKLAQEHL